MREFVRKIEKSMAREGLWATTRHGARFFWNRVGLIRPSTLRTSRERIHRDRLFDEQMGIRTSTRRVTARDDAVGPRWVGGHRYEGIDSGFDFGTALADLGIRFEEFVFVDVGAGMGRALVIAARLPFRRIIGVEYSAELARIARKNIEISAPRRPRGRTIEIVRADAVEYELPNDDLVLFLFNPFDRGVMEEFVGRVQASFEASRRRIVAVYLNPRFADIWHRASFVEHVRDWNGAAIFDTAAVARTVPPPQGLPLGRRP